MLWNPKHDQKKVAGEEDYSGEISARGLISWLERQPPDVDFNFCDSSGGCLIGQYLNSFGEFSRRNQDKIYDEKLDGETVGSIISLSVVKGILYTAKPRHGKFADALAELRERTSAESRS